MKRPRLLLWLLLLLLLVLTLFLALPFTETGSRLLVALAGRVSPVQIDYEGGRLFGEFRLRQLQVDAGALQLDLTGVHAQLQPACLLQATVCLDFLTADRLWLDTGAGE
ncbi:MAG: hypothetical protein ACK5HY_03200, partial [Parahaliea sp.]